MIIIIVIIIVPLCSQIFKIFFTSDGKGALTPLTKILRTPLRPRTELLAVELMNFASVEQFGLYALDTMKSSA